MKRIFCISILFFCLNNFGFAQMWNGVDTLFGNEWIQYDQEYFKLLVAEDGLYRVDKQTLEAAGVPINNVTGGQFQVYHNGEEVALYTSNDGNFGNQDYLEFYGKKNRSELDFHLFANPEVDMLNARYSLYTDTSAYFLTWNANNSTARYTETDNNLTNLPPKETAYMEELWMDFSNEHSKEYADQNVKQSYFRTAEGFASTYTTSQSHELNPTHPDLEGGTGANLYVVYATDYGGGTTSGNGVHTQTIKINDAEVAVDQTFRFNVLKHDFPIATSALEDPIVISFEGSVSPEDRQAVANLKLTYPRLFNFENENWKYFKIAGSGSVKYLEIENFNPSGVPVLYDLTNNIRITPTVENGVLKIALPPSATERELILASAAATQSVAGISSVSFVNYLEHESDYFIVTHPALNQPDNQGLNQVTEYVDYRSSSAGGSFSPLVIDINQLYDQYSYGIMRHPLSIRNFAQKLRKDGNLPEYFYLMGKGREYHSYRKSEDILEPLALPVLVPTFGYPGADNLLFSSNTTSTPVVAIGRLAASTPEDIAIYLDKVKEFEANDDNPSTIEDRAWMKRVIHLGGGGNAAEQTQLRNHLNSMKDIIENNTFGGEVNSFFKTSVNTVELSASDQIFDLINNGVSMITFFGHSGTNTFDFSIDNFERYFNEGKYPYMFSLGCYAGNVHTSFQGAGERFLFDAPRKGMIAFGASSSLGYVGELNILQQEAYRKIGEEMYGESIGKINLAVIQEVSNTLLAQQYTLHGDPALKVNPQEGPDLTISGETASFDPKFVNVNTETYDLNIDVFNIGRFVTDSVFVKVVQQLPTNQSIEIFNQKIATPAFSMPMTIPIESQGKASFGVNTFTITVDALEELEELPNPFAEVNNELVMELYIFDNVALPVYPSNFGIVNEAPTLRSSTANTLAPELKYKIEIDTTERFNSTRKEETFVTQIGGVIEWQPPVNWEDEQVYYWRISPDSISPQSGYFWENSSFVYLPNETGGGWNQSDFWQYEKNDFEMMKADESTGRVDFSQEPRDFRLKNKVFDPDDLPKLFVNGQPTVSVDPWDNAANDNTMCVMMINPSNFLFQKPEGSNDFFKTFKTNDLADREALMALLEDEVPEGFYVAVLSILRSLDSDLGIDGWAADSIDLGKNIFSIIEAQGGTKIRQLEQVGAVPYTIVYQKGAQNVIGESITALQGTSNVDFTLYRNLTAGKEASVMVGPAKKWENLVWQVDESTMVDSDSIMFKLLGWKADNTVDTLMFLTETSGNVSLQDISNEEYPRLQLLYEAFDAVNRSAPSVSNWRILYQELPDLALSPNLEYVFTDTLEQGQDLNLKIAVKNLHDRAVEDSISIKYTIINDLNEELVSTQKLPPFDANGEYTAEVAVSSKTLSGNHQLLVELNDNRAPEELHYFNNIALRGFVVNQDLRNPILDVTFDGVHILDGDIVSTKPEIVVTLKDENEYLELSDTSLFKLFLQYPSEAEPRKIYFSSEKVQFYPASLSSDGKNKARVEFSPELEVDGTYQLIVSANDVTGNQSGDFDYNIDFEIVSKEMISNVLNYPNPFSTSTRFVYTLTGKEPPAFFKIQIMTVSGRIVREITQDEIGPLQIGTHKTEYAWDGTDEFGDKLANGIYLYRVVVRNNDLQDFEDFDEHRNTNTDQFFKKGFGKMAIIR